MIDGKDYFTIENEIACLIDGFPDYAITSTGKVYTYRYKRFMKHHLNQDGYPMLRLRIGDNRKRKFIHRLVAEHFIPNPEQKPQVDHINIDRTDYRISNLRWVTPFENMTNRGSHNFCCKHCGKHQNLEN